MKAKRVISLFLLAATICTLLTTPALAATYHVVSGVGRAGVNTSSVDNYSPYWQYWCQGASKYKKVRDAGCRVVAQAKLLVECGAASSNEAAFNPDTYLEWAMPRGYWPTASHDIRELTATGQAAIAYAQAAGVSLRQGYESLSGTNSAQDARKVQSYIDAGYYVILHAEAHQAYVGRAASQAAGTPIVFDSWSNYSYTQDSCCEYLGYPYVYFTGFYYYSASGGGTPPASQGSASFSSYPEKHSIGQTNAVLAGKINISGASVTAVSKVGITLYDANGTQLAAKSETPNVDARYSYIYAWYDVNSELNYTLKPGTTYQYKLFAVVNGKTYYSNLTSFRTGGTAAGSQTSSTQTKPAQTLSVQNKTYCGYNVKVPAGYQLQGYGSPTSTKVTGYIKAQSGAYSLPCDQRLKMSDGSVRFYYTDCQGNSIYFVQTKDMSVTTVHDYQTSWRESAHPHRNYDLCPCGHREYGKTSYIQSCQTCNP